MVVTALNKGEGSGRAVTLWDDTISLQEHVYMQDTVVGAITSSPNKLSVVSGRFIATLCPVKS